MSDRDYNEFLKLSQLSHELESSNHHHCHHEEHHHHCDHCRHEEHHHHEEHHCDHYHPLVHPCPPSPPCPPVPPNFNNTYYETKGTFYNINQIGSNASDAFGANSTVNYIGVIFPTISRRNDIFEVINMDKNDYIIFDVTLEQQFLNDYNLFNYTPYFYDYTIKNVTTNVFASVSPTLGFFTRQQLTGKIKICCTSSNDVANYFSKQGYYISPIPDFYLSLVTFCGLFRIGLLPNSSIKFADIPSYFKASYFKSTSNNNSLIGYFDEVKIISSYPNQLKGTSPLTNLTIGTTYKSIISYFKSLLTYIQYDTYPYLSNFNDVIFPFIDFYDSISVATPVQLQANNTGENYCNSDKITVDSDPNKVFYIIALNQKDARVASTSNIQVYNASNLSGIATVNTAPELVSLSDLLYPIGNIVDPTYPTYTCSSILNSDLINNNITSILFIERLSYHPINFNYANFLNINKSVIFYGYPLTLNQIAHLNINFGITINSLTITV